MASLFQVLGATSILVQGRPGLPSLDDCKQVVKSIGSIIGPRLPQKDGPANIATLQDRAKQLQSPDGQTRLTQSTRQEILRRKDDLIGQYERICGKFYKDPSSPIFQAWERFEQAESAYNSSHLTPFDQANPAATDANEEVFVAFQAFLELDIQARGLFQQLVDLGSTMKSDPELLLVLETGKSSNAAKQNDEEVRNLYVNELMLAAPEKPELSLTAIVNQKTQTTLGKIQRQIEAQKHNVGIDWKKTTAYGLSAIVVPTSAYLANMYYNT
ncbi:MAG: hypothetical protein JSR39_04215 [Verrucomicrobia bacterium]|nr:hypothetical protein [Verrucomicrobiota bacterium]